MPRTTEEDTRQNPQPKVLKQLPADLQAYAQGYLKLCYNIIDGSREWKEAHPTLWVTAYHFGPDLMQNFFSEKDPIKKLEFAEKLSQACKILTLRDDPLEQQLGHIGEKLALGMKCFIGPNVDMVSQKSLRFIFNDQKLAEACADTLAAYKGAAASEAERGEMFFHHNEILNAFRNILSSVHEGNFEKAQKQAQTSMTMCSIYTDKYPIAHQAHGFFAIINFLLDSRVKGRLFGAEESYLGRS